MDKVTATSGESVPSTKYISSSDVVRFGLYVSPQASLPNNVLHTVNIAQVSPKQCHLIALYKGLFILVGGNASGDVNYDPRGRGSDHSVLSREQGRQ